MYIAKMKNACFNIDKIMLYFKVIMAKIKGVNDS